MARPLSRYIWLIETIDSAGKITYEEIRRRWLTSSANDTGEQDYPKRTFLSHIEEIKEIFGLSITCDRRNNYTYSITADNMQTKREELIGALSMSMKLLDNRDLMSRVHFTGWDFKNRFIPAILDAIDEKWTVEIGHALDADDFHREEIDTILSANPEDARAIISEDEFISEDIFGRITRLQPYFLEFVRHTWFVIGYAPARRRMEVFRLARINALEIREDLPFRCRQTLSFENVKAQLRSKKGLTGKMSQDLFDDRTEYRMFNIFNE